MEIKSLHTHVDIVARSKGASLIAKAAYNATILLLMICGKLKGLNLI